MQFSAKPLHRAVVVQLLVGLAVVAIAWTYLSGDRDTSVVAPGLAAPALATIGPQPATVDLGKPQRLLIPSIKVDAPVEGVGTTAAGAQDVPHSIDSTGWWRDGVRPGRRGNAVIVGHTAHAANGVFNNLGKLHTGATVKVRSQRGVLSYRVSGVRSIKVAKFDSISPLVYRTVGAPGLVLMTCGDWNGRRFETTTIVFATLAVS